MSADSLLRTPHSALRTRRQWLASAGAGFGSLALNSLIQADEAKKSGGLDQALVTLRDAPFGKFLLVAVAIGLACYGVYNVAKAWYLRQR